jgi:DNA-binding response OmpR family regulator
MDTILAVNASDVIKHLSLPLLAAGFRLRLDTRKEYALQFSDPPSAVVIWFQAEAQVAQELCIEVRQLAPEMPLIVMSPKTDVATKVRLLDLGADDYLEEPFATEELIARLRSIMRSRRPYASCAST